MSEQRHGEHFIPTGNGKDAEIIPFKARAGEVVDPNKLSAAECVSFFVHKWNHTDVATGALAAIINDDANKNDSDNEWQMRLQKIIHDSPLFDYYDEIIKADLVTEQLDSAMKSSMPARGTMSDERKAMTALMYMRGVEVITEPKDGTEAQLKHLPLGDEDAWKVLIQKLTNE